MLKLLTGGSLLWVVLGAFLVGAGIGGYAAGHWEAVALDEEKLAHMSDLKAVTDAANAQLAKNQEDMEKLQAALTAADQQHFKELTDAQNDNDQLRAAVAAGTRQLSISVAAAPASRSGVPAASRPTSLGDGASGQRAIIDRNAGQALIAIAAKADRYKAQLAACQDYARAVSTPHK